MKKLILSLLLVTPFAFAADLESVGNDLENELKSQNELLNKQRTKQFSERQKLARDIAANETTVKENGLSQKQQVEKLNSLQKALSELQSEYGKATKKVNKLKKLAVQIRREAQTSLPDTSQVLYSQNFDAHDKLLSGQTGPISMATISLFPMVSSMTDSHFVCKKLKL